MRRRRAGRCRSRAAENADCQTTARRECACRESAAVRPYRSARMAFSSVARCMMARLELGPFCAVHHQRNGVHRPGAFLALRIAVDVVGDAVGLNELLAGLPAAAELIAAPCGRGRRPACASGGAESRNGAALRPNVRRQACSGTACRWNDDGRLVVPLTGLPGRFRTCPAASIPGVPAQDPASPETPDSLRRWYEHWTGRMTEREEPRLCGAPLPHSSLPGRSRSCGRPDAPRDTCSRRSSGPRRDPPVEDQRRMHRNRRMQAARRLPGAIAHAANKFALRAGGLQRQAAAVAGDAHNARRIRPRTRTCIRSTENRHSAPCRPPPGSSPSTYQGSMAWRSSISMPS